MAIVISPAILNTIRGMTTATLADPVYPLAVAGPESSAVNSRSVELEKGRCASIGTGSPSLKADCMASTTSATLSRAYPGKTKGKITHHKCECCVDGSGPVIPLCRTSSLAILVADVCNGRGSSHVPIQERVILVAWKGDLLC